MNAADKILRRSSRHRGSLLLLVIAVLLLLLIVGIGYMEVSRNDRKATTALAKDKDISMVAKAALGRVAATLTDDLGFDNTGRPFGVDILNNDTGAAGTDMLPDQEPFDAPGWFDPWLASSAPISPDGGTTWMWMHTSWLGGFDLDADGLYGTGTDLRGGTYANGTVPNQVTVYNQTVDPRGFLTRLYVPGPAPTGIYPVGTHDQPYIHPGYNVNTTPIADYLKALPVDNRPVPGTGAAISADQDDYLGLFADADGDGLVDSRWMEAPIPDVHGLKFYVAYRVIDNSSMINLNTATCLINNAGAYDTSAAGTNAPRWTTPSELDAGVLVRRIRSASFAGELAGVLQSRLTTNAQPTPWAGIRELYWNVAGLYDNYPTTPTRFFKIGIENELELRFRNGLNNPEIHAPIELADMDPYLAGNQTLRFLLRGSTSVNEERELFYIDKPMISPATTNPVESPFATVPAYFQNNARLLLTTFSGHSIIRPTVTTDVATDYYKRDINAFLVDQAAAANLPAQITNVYNVNSPATIPAVLPDINTFADQFSANVKDYADTDNRLCQVNGRYGLEALPAISEVYLQRAYRHDGTQWQQQGDVGYCIEVRNPFRKRIKLEDIHLYVNGAKVEVLSTLAGVTELGPDEILYLYKDSVGGVNDSMAALIAAPETSISGSAFTHITAPAMTYVWPTMGTIRVELRASDEGGAELAWPYQAMDVDSDFLDNIAAMGTAGDQGYRQSATKGNGRGVNTILVNATPAAAIAPTTVFQADYDSLGIADKAGVTYPGPANLLDPLTNQIVIADDTAGKIRQIGELAHVFVLGLDGTMTIADAWGGATDMAPYFLQFGNNELMDATASRHNHLKIPHAVFLIDRFTTLSPFEDTYDNDGDGTADNVEERLIPGTINLNTATYQILSDALPITDATAKDEIIRAVLGYRHQMDNISTMATNRDPAAFRNNRPTGHRDEDRQPGIAYMGEIFNLFNANNTQDIFGAGVAAPAMNDGPGSSHMLNGTVIDFLPSDTPAEDGVDTDQEEASKLLRWLSQTCAVRSDVFTAYIAVRSYKANPAGLNTNTPPNHQNLVDERRYIAVFDRSTVTSGTQLPRMVGIFEY